MLINTHKDFQILRNCFFIKGTLTDINTKYFIDKIEEGIKEETNLSHHTSVQGGMTSWRFFNNDKEFHKVIFKLMDYIEDSKIIDNKKYYLEASWGIKEGFGNFTRLHEHIPSILSGVIYLSHANQKLYFPEINENIDPSPGSFALFPGFLKHGTKHRSSDDSVKYGIAFNFYIVAD